MKKIILTTGLIMFLCASLFAQDRLTNGSELCSQKKMNNPNITNLFNFDSPNLPVHSFDVLDYKIYVDIRNCFISPYPNSFTGNVTVKFRVDSTLNSIKLNAVNTSIIVNSVSMSGVSFTHSSNVLTINLDRTYAVGETAEVKVNYSHIDVTDNAFYASGGFVFTDCEPEGARKWFPCYDKPSDKATVDITARVKGNVKLGSNGRLNDSLVTGDTAYYHWISRDPVSTYLVVLTGKVNYNLNIVYWHKISNPSDSVPLRFYYNSGENITNMKTKVPLMMTLFSEKFGEHPFEKNGFATLNSQFTWGGMENQTLTSLCQNCWNENIISHELAHQWFGDMITCGTWADIWLNEGFATYLEAIWYENTGGYSAYKNDIVNDANSYLSGNPGWAMYNPSWAIVTPSTSELFNTQITYYKGACVLHMLRYTLGDSLFFDVVKSYATDTLGGFKYNSAVTDDFTAKISAAAGEDLSWFINQWVKEPNHPVYQNYYSFLNTGGSNWNVNFISRQTQTNSVFHKMPIVIKVAFATGPDTSIKVMNDANYQTFVFNFNRQPTGLTFDPNNDIVLKQGTTTQQSVSSKTLTLNIFVQGFYDESTNSMIQDTGKVFLRNTSSPYELIDSAAAVLNSAGTGVFTFSNIFNDAPYYIQFKHRNTIETWSSSPGQMFTGSVLNYNFTDLITKAYGSNMIQIDQSPVKFGVYSGDVDQNGIIDLADGSLIDNDAANFALGYLTSDVNGDGLVDLPDAVFADNNGFNFVVKITP
ncbi:MAG: M1 family aminopeptidase [Ignavibacteria bacterium]